MRAALGHLAATGDGEGGLRLWWCIWRFWSDRGQWGEARGWLRRLLALGGADRPRARCLFAGGMIALRQRDDDDAERLLRDCLAAAGGDDGWRWRAAALTQLGHLDRRRGDPQGSAALHREALTLRRELGNAREVAISLCGLGFALGDLGDLAEAEALLTEALGLFRAWGDQGEEGAILYELAGLASRRGDSTTARLHLATSLAGWWERGARGRIVAWLTDLAARCADAAPSEALRLLAALEALADCWGLPHAGRGGGELAALVAALHDRLGPAAEAIWAAGETTDRAALVALATAAITRQAEAHAARGDA